MSDDAIWLLRVENELRRARIAHPESLPLAPAPSSAIMWELGTIEHDARVRQHLGRGTRADVLVEEVCERLRATPGTVEFEAECVQIAACVLRDAQASRALRTSAHACARMREDAPTQTGSDDP